MNTSKIGWFAAAGMIALLFGGRCSRLEGQITPEPTPVNDPAAIQQVREAFTSLLGPKHRLGKVTADNISDQYRDFGQAMIAADHSKNKETIQSAIREDFDRYEVVSVDDVTVYRDVAFVVAKIKYDPSRLPELRKDEKNNKADGGEDSLPWDNAGGWSSAARYEEHGSGLATYVLAMQHGAWKIHSTYYSLRPFSASDLTDGASFFQTELFKSPAELAKESSTVPVSYRKIRSFSQLTDESAWKSVSDYESPNFMAKYFGVHYNVCMEDVRTKQELDAPLRFPSLVAFVAAIRQPPVQVLVSGENSRVYYAVCRIKPDLCVYAVTVKDDEADFTAPELTGTKDGQPGQLRVKQAGVTELFERTRVLRNKITGHLKNNALEVFGTVYRLPTGYTGPLTMKAEPSDKAGQPAPISITVHWE